MEESKIYNYRIWLAKSETVPLKNKIEEMLKAAGYGIVGFSEHHFQPQGYTCTWLLSESHCALHTFPEEGRSYIELSGCSEAKNSHFVKAANAAWKDYIRKALQSVC
ncbi:MAG: S-adenosylmethionine decarboxylase [Bacteroidetes bacterium]|nr:S-adenosylmethionine decarboxylase [Bacteroidota bacterium]